MVADLYDLLRQSRVLILAPALTDETRNMIGAVELATLPKDAIVINVGRGQVLDLDALAGALDKGQRARRRSRRLLPRALAVWASPALEPEGYLHSARRWHHYRGDVSTRPFRRGANHRVPKGKVAD